MELTGNALALRLLCCEHPDRHLALMLMLHPFCLDLLALSDVADGRDHESALGRLQGTEADFDGHLPPILASRIEVQVCAHRPGAGRRRIGGPVPHMAVTEP